MRIFCADITSLIVRSTLLGFDEKKSLSSGNVLEAMEKSTAKSMEEALAKPEAISSLNLNDQGLECVPKQLDGRLVNLIQVSLQKKQH